MSALELRSLLDEPEQFREWLKSKPARRIVGARKSRYWSPLARFLKEVGRAGDEVIVTGSEIRFANRADRMPLPAWAQKFAARVNGLPVAPRQRTALTLLEGDYRRRWR